MRLIAPVAVLTVCFVPAALGQLVSLAIGGGAGPASGNVRVNAVGQDASPKIGGTVLLNPAVELLRRNSYELGIEVPVALHGSRSSDAVTSSSYAGFYTERVTAALTPGVRARFRPVQRVSPWLSFGAGVALVRRTGADFLFGQQAASQNGSSRTVALAPAAGLDVRMARGWFVRGELRNYVYRTPSSGFVSSFAFWSRWTYNPVAAVSVGFRFRM